VCIPTVYKSLCPVCGKDISVEELENDACRVKDTSISSIFSLQACKQFEEFFLKKANFRLNSLQRYWACKLLEGLSFAVVAPTGTGKTLFGLIYSTFLAEKNKKCYIIVPTTLLLIQSYKRLVSMLKEERLLAFLPRMNKEEKKYFFLRLKRGEFNILLTTAAFLSKHFDKMKGIIFDFIFVDDVDAVLKASRNVERLLMLLGFSEKEIKNQKKTEEKNYGQLVVSTATAKPGKKALLFSKLLNFSVGSTKEAVRNIDEYAIVCDKERTEIINSIIKKMGHGGLVFTPTEEDAYHVHKKISRSVKCKVISSRVSKKERDKSLQEFLDEKIDVLIGVSSPYGLLVKGIDYPLSIRYAVFYGIPHFKIGIKDIKESSPKMLLLLASIFRKDESLERNMSYILSQSQAREAVRKKLIEIFRNREFHKAREDIIVENDEILIPDISTYLQASGRTSRIFAGGVTKGVSFVLDEEKKIQAFENRARYYDLKIVEKSIDEIPFADLKEEIEETRRKSRKPEEDFIKPALFVVESPTKAKQISRFFGKPAVFVINSQPFYEVMTGKYVLIVSSSLGHLTDLVERGYYHGVKIENERFVPVYGTIKKCTSDGIQFVEYERCPKCGSEPGYNAKNRLYNFIKIAAMTGCTIIATDPDTEGEKIAWDIANFAGVAGKIKRAEFHEITKNAVIQALNSLREINENLVKAQVIRRIEDRWIGFELSSVLQKEFHDKNLSAGRAQTPVLGWIVERCKEHKKKVRRYLLKIDDSWIVLGDEIRIKTERKTQNVEVLVEKIEERTENIHPLPPYTTDNVLKDMNRILRLSAKDGMKVLQELFENGFITYHRTDSTRVSSRGLDIAKTFLKEEFVGRVWKGGKEGAHECIRPTRPFDWKTLRDLVYQGVLQTHEHMTFNHFRVYDLIFKRFMASQCSNIEIKVVKYRIKIGEFTKIIEVVTHASGKAYDLYPYSIRMEKPLPEGKVKGTIICTLKNKANLLTQADAISLMKERGIGRPSTYATLLEKLFIRHYIFEKDSKLIPTRRGMKVEEFLNKNYKKFVSEERTRLVEKLMDDVENGKIDYTEVLKNFYEEIISVRD